MAELAPLNSRKSDQFLQIPRSDTNLSRRYSGGHDFGYEFHTTNQNGKLSIPTISSNNNIRSATSQPHLNDEGQQEPVQGSQKKFGKGMMYRKDILYQGSLRELIWLVETQHTQSRLNSGLFYNSRGNPETK
ncbi:uncharacterized protein LOC129920920 [Episyrphus balteatus]|uniref:uncharacterized protein LOC129920920 n=1 Tax=Episyrphus balteatus TaxID=286459 RepID=UPI0024857A42|nr:uncharacterized protein LOC129920920 [Episyrphus balteatus]XP_055858418.1 uncharacterized protein LOC129920920 [Episyrphus balteatus]